MRRSCVPCVSGIEGLEKREVLSAGLRVPAFKINLGVTIQGTIHGSVTEITPISPTAQLVNYTGIGKANIIGDGHGSGHHVITSHAAGKKPTNDTYSQGQLSLAGTTDQVQVTYTGTGHTKADGSFTATLKGTAQSVAGQHAGLSGGFTATLSGNNRTGTFTVTFKIKL